MAEDIIVLTKEDVLQTIDYVKKLVNGEGFTDDIDNLSNRRVRGVGELLSIQVKGGMLKMSKMVREKMTVQDITTLTPQSLLNTKPLNALILEFFGSGQLSQFMDQSNPLAELTHKEEYQHWDQEDFQEREQDLKSVTYIIHIMEEYAL